MIKINKKTKEVDKTKEPDIRSFLEQEYPDTAISETSDGYFLVHLSEPLTTEQEQALNAKLKALK